MTVSQSPVSLCSSVTVHSTPAVSSNQYRPEITYRSPPPTLAVLFSYQ